MAAVTVSEYHKFTVNAANAYKLRNEQSFSMGTYLISFINDASFSGSITIKSVPMSVKRHGNEGPDIGTTALTPVPVPYVPLNVNGTAGDRVPISTALTTAFLIEVDSSGQDIVLDVTSYSSGSGTCYVHKLKG